MITCPWHDDKTPSCKVYDHHVHCFGCGKHADSIELWSKLKGYDNEAGFAELRELFGINGANYKRSRRKESQPKSAQQKRAAKLPNVARALRIEDAPPVEQLGRELNFEWIEDEDDDGIQRRSAKPRPYHETVNRLLEMSQGLLLKVQNLVFSAPVNRGEEDVQYLKSAPPFFGWLGDLCRCQIEWKTNTGTMSKPEAFAAVASKVTEYDGIESMPHHPPMDRLYYNHPALPEPDQAAFDELLERFSPETEDDRALIAAMFLTAVWGGGLGQRPAFIITSRDGRGAGKTTLGEMVAHLLNQHPISGCSKEKLEDMKTRLLSPEGLKTRVALFDNETGQVSSGQLAGMITGHWLSGRRLYAGEGKRPNNLLWILTLNTPSLDSDLASRGIPISVRKADYSPTWEEETLKFVNENRWEIISALIDLLNIRSPQIQGVSRFGAWENEVLSRVAKWTPDNDVSRLMKLIQDRQRAFDDEANENELIAEEFERAVKSTSKDPDLHLHFIGNSLAAHLYNEATGRRVRKRTSLREIDELIRTGSIPRLEKTRRRNFGRGYYWSSKNTPADAPIVVVPLPEEGGF
jgi:predicted Fe-S protein YdhL (DUF1289 family)